MEQLTFHFGLQGDGTVYHERSAASGACAGMAVTGPERLLETLELHLGLSGIYPGEQAKILGLKSHLDKVIDAGFPYAKAYRTDPLSVTKRLLHLWDSWQLAGWQVEQSGELPSRMKMIHSLKDAFLKAGPGIPERLQKLFASLDKGACLPDMTIYLTDPPDSFPYLYQQLLSKLEKYCDIKTLPATPRAPSDTDLGKLQRIICGKAKTGDKPSFKNDGTLNILYFPCDLDAANAVFAIQQNGGWNPLIVNTDNSLLNGLYHSHGRPVCEWQTAAGNGQVSQLFFLATAMFLRPVNTSQILGFLSSPFTPFSKALASGLMESFAKKPGIGNDQWEEKLKTYLDSIKGSYRETAITRGINFWLRNPRCLQEPFEISFLIEIYQTLETWALNIPEEAGSKGSYQEQLINLGSLCQHLIGALKDEGEYISQAKFERLQSQVFRDVPSLIREAEARSCDLVTNPGAVWAKAKEILWMNATRVEGPESLSKYWYQEEKDFFTVQGLPLPDESHAYSNYSKGVTRMVLLASKRLVIAVPAKVNGTVSEKPYCLDEWNQLISLKPVTTKVTGLLDYIPWKPEIGLTSTHRAISLPKQADTLKVPKGEYKRETESYSSLEKLFQHPAIWYLQYHLMLTPKAGISLPGLNALKGMVADRVVQKVFTRESKEAAWWGDNKLFTREVLKQLQVTLEQEGLPFLEKKSKRFLCEYEKAVLHAAINLKSIIDINGFLITGTQVKVKGILNGQAVEGSIDLVLEKGGKKLVIDLKWSGNSNWYYDCLKSGRDLQLSLYSSMDSDVAKSAYFMLHDARLLIRKEPAQRELKGHGVHHIVADRGVTTSAVLKKAENSLQYRLKELNRGGAEGAYHVLLADISYYVHQDAKDLYPLQETKAMVKLPPPDSDYDLFFGNIR